MLSPNIVKISLGFVDSSIIDGLFPPLSCCAGLAARGWCAAHGATSALAEGSPVTERG